MGVQNFNFVVLSVPDIIRGTQKIWAVPGYAQGFEWAFVRMDPANVPAKFEIRSFTSS